MEYLYSTHTYHEDITLDCVCCFGTNANENVVKQVEQISAWHNMMKITVLNIKFHLNNGIRKIPALKDSSSPSSPM